MAGALALSSSAPGQVVRVQNQCANGNVPCLCSYQCCGEERCDGVICGQCVVDCVQRKQVVDDQFVQLRSRCQSMIMRGFKRL
jgi:hypothetical protein